MRFYFKNKKLKALYTKGKDAHKYPEVVEDFFAVMAIIEAAESEQDLYAFIGLRFEQLFGKQRSLRLNNQWCLIALLEQDEQGEYLLIVDIKDYH